MRRHNWWWLFGLLRRACVLPVPQRLTISARVAPLKISTFDKQRRGAKKYVRVGIKKKKERTMASGVFWCASLRGKAGEGEKRMARLYGLNRGDENQLWRGHVYIKMWNLYLRLKCPCGWWIMTSTLSWTVMQLAASFWRISVTPLESLSYFSLGSSSLSSSWFEKVELSLEHFL